MPVHVAEKGTAIIENATGRVVAHAKSRRKAHIYAYYRNKGHEEKMRREGK